MLLLDFFIHYSHLIFTIYTYYIFVLMNPIQVNIYINIHKFNIYMFLKINFQPNVPIYISFLFNIYSFYSVHSGTALKYIYSLILTLLSLNYDWIPSFYSIPWTITYILTKSFFYLIQIGLCSNSYNLGLESPFT